MNEVLRAKCGAQEIAIEMLEGANKELRAEVERLDGELRRIAEQCECICPITGERNEHCANCIAWRALGEERGNT